jgi:hypothetical protein
MTRDNAPEGGGTPDSLRPTLERLFSKPESARYGPYQLLGDGDVVVPGLLHRFLALDARDEPLELQVFSGVGDFAGWMWEEEVRILLRLSARAHPALPRVLAGGHDADAQISWVGTDIAGTRLSEARLREDLRADPGDCVRQLNTLADGLALLHGQGIMHRNIQPSSIDVERPHGVDKGRVLRLTRFEMSSMLDNLMRSGPDPRKRTEEVRQHFIAQGVRSLVYVPPERLDYLLAGGELFEDGTGDVFSLAMMAFEWFVEPLDVDPLLESGAQGADLPDALRDFRRGVRTKLANAPLPAPLRDVLGRMLAESGRLTSAQVVHRLTKDYDALVSSWERPPDGKPLLTLFMPERAQPTIYRWKWAIHPPDTDVGRQELRHLHEQDMRGAILVHSPGGAQPYAGAGDASDMARAEWVLIGKRAAWFAEPFRPWNDERRALDEPMDDVLIIKYVVPRHQALDLLEQPFQRRVPAVEALPWQEATKVEAVFAALRSGRSSWRPLLEGVRSVSMLTDAQMTYRSAVEWLLDLEEVEVQKREYPFVRDSETPGRRDWVRIRYDRARDDARIRSHRTGLFAALAADRPAFAEFLESDEALAEAKLELRADRNGRPDTSGRWEAIDVRRPGLDEGVIEVQLGASSRPLPDRGWIRPIGDGPARLNLRRQIEASAEMRAMKDLVEQLASPRAIRGYARRWAGAGKELAGTAGSVVQELLVSQPFFAIHGPPGTGKTTVVAHAVEAFMRSEPFARVLISAQANDALDHLGETVQARLRAGGLADVTAVRMGSPRGDQSSAEMASLRLPEQTRRLQRDVKASLQRQLAHGRPRGDIRALIERWLEAVDTSALELQDRVRRGAGIVYATCSGSSRRMLDIGIGFGAFDWVIVEEAAKAWPTELAIPLVRGVRWTLIGDHRQLPAYRRQDIEETLRWLTTAPTAELRRHGEQAAEYRKVFDPLGTLFSKDGVERLSLFPDRPLAALTLQFRMRKPIADLVSSAFYDGELDTDPSTERPSGLRAPRQLIEPALVWVDTGGRPDCFDVPRWRNDGEAQIVARLLDLLEPFPEPNRDGFSNEPLAILTPWRQQRTALRRFVPERAQELVYTVDSFQGREADIVIASLVRHQPRGTTTEALIGHAARPERINVMLSRARRLLVLVGNFEHFLSSGVDFWESICTSFETSGVVVSADELL